MQQDMAIYMENGSRRGERLGWKWTMDTKKAH